jgi:hypothetical protein
VDRFLFALWDAYLYASTPEALGPGVWVDEDLLEAILRLTPDPTPYLTRWRDVDWRGARDLAWFISSDHLRYWLTWETDDRASTMANWQAVRAWLDAPETRLQLEAAIAEAPAPIRWEYVLALEVLDRGRTRSGTPFRAGTWSPDAQSVERARALGVDLSLIP